MSRLAIFAALIAILATAEVTLAQSGFGEIPDGNIQVRIEEFARLPNSQSAPARANLMTTDPTGRLFVNDQRGQLYTVSGDGSTVVEYLDLNSQGPSVVSSSEQGFHSFTFHPDFATAGTDGFGKFYTIHSTDTNVAASEIDFFSNPAANRPDNSPHHTVLLEWTTDTPAANTFTPSATNSAPRELMRFEQPYSNHNAGLIAFNVDGPVSDRNNLYVAIGDGGSGNDPPNNSQDLSNPFGAILRIDPLGSNSDNDEYGIVADNEFAGDMDPNTLGEIYSYGLRNPQRFGWDADNNNMFIADIGQNAFEEINLGADGGNFGWRDREGSFMGTGSDLDDFIDPVSEYSHGGSIPVTTGVTGNRAITVGEVLRGGILPELEGHLLLGDFPSGTIFTLDVDEDSLDGGQDGLGKLVLLDELGAEKQLLELINTERNAQNLGDVSRTDLRFSINTDDVFILNKQDGVIRRLVSTAIPEPGALGLLVVLASVAAGRWRSNLVAG